MYVFLFFSFSLPFFFFFLPFFKASRARWRHGSSGDWAAIGPDHDVDAGQGERRGRHGDQWRWRLPRQLSDPARKKNGRSQQASRMKRLDPGMWTIRHRRIKTDTKYKMFSFYIDKVMPQIKFGWCRGFFLFYFLLSRRSGFSSVRLPDIHWYLELFV